MSEMVTYLVQSNLRMAVIAIHTALYGKAGSAFIYNACKNMICSLLLARALVIPLHKIISCHAFQILMPRLFMLQMMRVLLAVSFQLIWELQAIRQISVMRLSNMHQLN